MNDLIETPLDELMCKAEQLRKEYFGNKIELCGIVNAKSGACAMDCSFCAQSLHHATKTVTYPLHDQETLSKETFSLWDSGALRVGWVTSGCRLSENDLDRVVDAAKTVSGNISGKKICASMGQLNTEQLGRLKAAGVSRYHHNLETSERFYPKICSTQKWQDRLTTVRRAKDLGFEVCSGGLFGLGETWEDRIALAETLRGLDVDSVPINFFNPIAGTSLAHVRPLNWEEALRIIAVLRILLPKTSLRICGGRPTVLREHQEKIIAAGADAVMTGNYLTTSGISPQRDCEWITKSGCQICDTA